MVNVIRHRLASGLKNLTLAVLALLAALVLLASGLWWWAATDGSLATAVRWADNYAPQLTLNLSLQNPRGSLRAGGQFDRITWQRDGLKLDATAVTLAWQPWALVSGTLQLDRLIADTLTVDNRQPKTRSAGPPESLRLPVRVVVDEFAVANLQITGAAAFAANNIAGNFRFDGSQHALAITRSTVASGSYSGRASVAADQPYAVNATLQGIVASAIPGSSRSVALSFKAAALGTLADVKANASLQIDNASGSAAGVQPNASVTARVTPWAVQPVPQLDAVFKNLDVAALWSGAPQTLLTGSASVAPISAGVALNTPSVAAWALELETTNRLSGPWDKKRLPVSSLVMLAEWRDGMAIVKSLDAALAGGTLVASGQTAGTQSWTFQAALKNINPQALHSQLAALPLQGQITGSWNALLAGGTLALPAFDLKTREARLNGSMTLATAAKSILADISLAAPGLVAKVRGELRRTTGKGELAVQARNAALAQRWLQQLPGIPGLSTALGGVAAAGSGALTASWQGGWQINQAGPSIQAQLNVPALDITPSSSQPATTPTVLKFRAVQAALNGKLSQASFSAQGRLETGQRRYAVQAGAEAGRANAGSVNAGWQGLLKQLVLRVDDPALGAGTWQLATQNALTFRWQPGLFASGAGQAQLTAPTRGIPAVVAWQPVKWQAGQLMSAGSISGLPMQWIELIMGPQTAAAGLTGNLVFDGAWDAKLGDTLALKASLARTGGDIVLRPEGIQTAAPITAGVRQARISVDSLGNDVTLALQWDSERAGAVDAQLKTRLARTGTGNWQWPADAALAGQLKAQLPRIGVWSALAPPGWRLRGSLAADINVSGTRAAPQLKGELQANDLALRSVVDGIEFAGGKLRASLEGNRMRIAEFTLQGAGGAAAGGTLTAQGEAAWVNNQPQVALSAKLDRLRASLRSDRQVTLSGNLLAALNGKLAQLTGSLKIDQARFLLPEDTAPQLGNDVVVRARADADKAKPVPASQLPNSTSSSSGSPTRSSIAAEGRGFTLNIQLDLGQDLRVSGKGLNTLVRGTLVLAGDSLAQPRLTGSVNTFAGSYRAYGQQLDVERGILRFMGPLDNPALDILAIRPNLSQAGQRVGVQILGTALLPRVSLYAQPDLPEAEKLSWLVLGRASASGGGEAALLQQAAFALLGGKDGNLSGGLAASLGLDELSFRGASSNADGTTSAGAVTLGKRFSRNFYVAYERSVSGALGTLLVFYDLSQRFTLRAQAGQQSAVDLIFTLPFD